MNIGWIMHLILMKNKFDAAIHKEILMYLYLLGVLAAHRIYDASSNYSPSLMKIHAHWKRPTPLLEYRHNWNYTIHINNTGDFHPFSYCAHSGCLTWGCSLVLFKGVPVILLPLLGLNKVGWGCQRVYAMAYIHTEVCLWVVGWVVVPPCCLSLGVSTLWVHYTSSPPFFSTTFLLSPPPWHISAKYWLSLGESRRTLQWENWQRVLSPFEIDRGMGTLYEILIHSIY